MQPTDAMQVVSRATSEGTWVAGLLALIVLVLTGLVAYHYRAMWSHIRQMSADQQEVVDDNTLAWLQVSRVLLLRPCLHDSDSNEMLRKTGLHPDDFGDQSDHVKRVLERREKRKSSREKTGG